jgi:hypothetical protein
VPTIGRTGAIGEQRTLPIVDMDRLASPTRVHGNGSFVSRRARHP